MGLINVVTNEIKAAVGYQQSFDKLLSSNDVSRALNYMECHAETAVQNLKEYNIQDHKVSKRQDKAIYDKKGNFKRWKKRWKLPIPYPQFINEIALVFLYGRPLKWLQESEGTDIAFQKYKSLIKDIRFDALVRECKRFAGAEGKSALLYHLYRDDEGKPQLLLNVLSKTNGDDIYVMKDQYKRMKAFAWGYSLSESKGKIVYHVDIYTANEIYRCKRGTIGWEVMPMENPIGKIPIILFEQEVEHAAVQPLIERYEWMTSIDADVNDQFANPAMVATAEILNDLPKAEEEAKLYILKDGGEVRYLTFDNAPEAKKNELDRLDTHILNKTFTPQIDFDNMKALSNVSAKALRQMMTLAFIKAEKRKETHDGYMSRASNLLIAIMGNVLDYPNKSMYDALKIGHEFQDPFGEDVSETLADILKQYGAGALSKETTVELSYLVKNAKLEMERIKKEEIEALERQREMTKMDAFGEAD
ncbi:MAG TPA: phage portal protein [Porphyromonadaceae bacterium]|nr:phage portal protein [Porphyromonadaceae bacterium]